MRIHACVTGLLIAAFACPVAPAAGQGPVGTPPQDVADSGQARVIVKLRRAAAQGTASASVGDPADVAALAARTGVSLRQTRRIVSNLRVLEVGTLAAPGA